ncbi:hypothetical protein D9M73_147990 [compost metagenome]
MAGADQRFGQAGIVIGQHDFEPFPLRATRFLQEAAQFLAESGEDRARQRVPGECVQDRSSPQHRKGVGARRPQFERQRRRHVEHRHRPIPVLGELRVARGDAERPQRAAVRVLRPEILAPGAIEIHEVAETPRLGIPRILQERRIDRHPLVALAFVHRRHLADQHQRAGVVVDTIAMAAVGHRIDRML